MAGLKGKSGPPDNMNAFKHGSRPDNFASLIPSKTKIYGNAASTIVSAYGEQLLSNQYELCATSSATRISHNNLQSERT
jgi:hypothetical protein